MDRATKAVMDYDEAVALNGGRNKKREEPFPAPPPAADASSPSDFASNLREASESAQEEFNSMYSMSSE